VITCSQPYLFSKFEIAFEFSFSFCFHSRGQEAEQYNNPKNFHLRIGSKPLSKNEKGLMSILAFKLKYFPPTRFYTIYTQIPRLFQPNPPPKQNSLHCDRRGTTDTFRLELNRWRPSTMSWREVELKLRKSMAHADAVHVHCRFLPCNVQSLRQRKTGLLRY